MHFVALEQPKEMLAVTWNILAPVYMRCTYYTATACPDLQIEKRRPIIVRQIHALDADILCLQEVTHSEFQALQKVLPEYRWFFRSHAWTYWKESPKHERNGNVVALRRSLNFHHITSQSWPLGPEGNRALCVRATRAGQSFTLVSLHLDPDDSLRARQWEKLRNHLQQTSTDVVLVGGDFNQDHLPRLPGFLKSPARPTYFEEDHLSIDHLFVKGLTPVRWHIPRSNRENVVTDFGSDHVPVSAALM